MRADDPGLSTAQIEVRDGGLVVTTGLVPADAQEFLPVSARRDETWTQEDLERVLERPLKVSRVSLRRTR